MKKQNKLFFSSGFSFVELSISLVIIGMIASSAISLAISSDYWVKQNETQSKMDRIEEAIAGFLESNQRLPCPADGTDALSDPNFGVEVPADGDNNGDCTSPNFSGTVGRGGVVPVVTLQLPNDFMFDGWGRRITYYVDTAFARNDTTNPSCASSLCFRDDAAGALRVNDATGAARTTQAIYVLLSHGETGHGAFLMNGGADVNSRLNFLGGTIFSADSAAEIENAEFDASGATTTVDDIFIMKSHLKDEDQETGETNEIFDDIIRFKTKAQAVKDAGYILYDTVCQTASNIVNSPGSNVCTGVTNEPECEEAAEELSIICLQ